MPTVDSLDIQISAESKKASVAIDNLVKKLDRVSASLSGVNTRGLATMASGVNKLSNAMANFSKNTKTADFSRITRNLNKLGEINPNSIAVASKSLGKIAVAMKAFDSINVSDNAAKLAELSKGISTLGYKSAEKALDNIPKLATAMKSFMKTLSTAPKVSQNIIDMTNAMARFARTGSSGGKAANELANSMSNMSRKFASIPSVFKKVNVTMSSSVLSLKNLKQALASVIGTFGGIYAVFNGLKKSIDISSDLTEVQNVVDVAFGKYKKSIEDFSKISIKDFGMSELTAKTMAGRFQSMGTAIGFSQKKMSGMSVELTKLAADMASFYNVEQEDVAESLQSIFTGQTKPLRAYGLDLTQATIEEWAHKQGIDAKMKSMSHAEKTMLRYKYVMANTGAAQGDFARTANTWANQVRVLKQNFEVLGSTIGGVLINALKPFVKGLNVIMLQITDFAKIISNALGKIFGWKYEDGGGITNPADDMAESMEDVADATDDATKAQKEYNRQLGKFDELNNYSAQKNNTNGTDGTTGTSIPSSTNITTGVWTKSNSMLKEYESEIDSLYELGETIGDTISKSIENINWKKVYEKARNFGTGLAKFLNGLISPRLFGNLGKTIAGSLNTSLEFLDSFGTTFDWKDFGNSIASGINKFFKTFDFKLFATTFNKWANGLLTTMITSVKGVNWKLVPYKIAELINGIDTKGISWNLGKLSNSLANAFYMIVSNKETWTSLGTKIGDGINGFFEGMSEVDEKTGLTGWQSLGKDISETFMGIGDSLITALDTIDWDAVGQGIGDAVKSIEFSKVVWKFVGVGHSLFNAVVDFLTEYIKTDTATATFVGAFGALKLTGLDTKLSSIITTFLGKHNLTLGKVLIGIGLGAATLHLADSDDKVKRVIGAPITAALSTFTFTGDVKLAVGIAGVALAITGGFTLGQLIGNAIQDAISIEDMKEYRYEIKFSDLISYSPTEWKQGFDDWWNDVNPFDDIKEFFTTGEYKDFELKIPFTDIELPSINKAKKKIHDFVEDLGTKTIFLYYDTKEKTSGALDKLKNKWESVKTKTANLTANAREKVSGSLKKIKESWLSIKNSSAVKTLQQKGYDTMKKVKKTWDSFTSKKIKLDVVTDLVKAGIKNVVNWINKYIINNLNKLKIKVAGKNIGIDIPKMEVPAFKNGGFPEDGWFRASKGEYFGQFDDGTSYIANNKQIENGIASEVGGAIRNANMEQNMLLREQNELLRGILMKETGISAESIFSAVRNQNSIYKKRYGESALI